MGTVEEITSETVSKLYGSKADLYHLVFYKSLGYHRCVKAFLGVSDYLRPNLRVLDAGCGTGLCTRVLYKIAEHKHLTGIEFFAFDLTAEMLRPFRAWIKQKDAKNIHVQQANVLAIEQLPPDYTQFDLLISSAMLEHVAPPQFEQALSNLRSLGRPGATLLIFITKKSLWTNWLVGKMWTAHTYEKEQLERTLAGVGLHDIVFREFPAPFGYMNQGVFIVEAKL